jgi:hypothetical protein
LRKPNKKTIFLELPTPNVTDPKTEWKHLTLKILEF